MRLNPLSLMGSSYADTSLAWSAQRTLNWLPETAEVEGTRTPVKFADIPGLRAVVDLGTGRGVREVWNVEGKLFAVSGSSLFEVSTAYVATNRGSIPGVGRVSMAHNKQGGVAAANELVVANGLSGYVYNTATEALAQITDAAFQGASTVDYVDGYITFTDPQGRFWGHSALNQATNFSSIDRYDAESAPDPIVSHIVSHREVMVFGTRTTEFFRNTGAATGTFQRVDGTELEVGICAPFARARIDNSVGWVADSLEVFRLEGHSPQRISTRPIEQMLATVNPANIFCTPWEDRGHKVLYVTAPEAFTLGFDFASGMWHERQTFDLPRWRGNALAFWNNQWIVGDYSNGLLYVLDWDTHHENGLELVRERASGYTHGGQNKVLAPYVELLFGTGTDQAEGPTIMGNVPDGLVGDAGAGQYVVSGGTPPYSDITVLSGTTPPGFTLNPDGTYTYAYTTRGTYSWTVGGTDADGRPFSVADTATICEQVMGLQTHTATLTGSDIVASINYRDDNKVHYTAAADGLAVAGTVSFGAFDSTLATSDTGTYTVQSGSPGDARLWSYGYSQDGWTFGPDLNFDYAELWQGGSFAARVKPTSGDVNNWFPNTDFGQYGKGGQLWPTETAVYFGARNLGASANTGRIYRWTVVTSGTVQVATAISPVLSTGPIHLYFTHLGRDGLMRAIDPVAKTLVTLDPDDLSITATVSLAALSLTTLKAFAVDHDKLFLYRDDTTNTVTAYRLSDLSSISAATISGTVYTQDNEKLLCTDDSIYLQTGVNVKRIDYALLCTAP